MTTFFAKISPFERITILWTVITCIAAGTWGASQTFSTAAEDHIAIGKLEDSQATQDLTILKVQTDYSRISDKIDDMKLMISDHWVQQDKEIERLFKVLQAVRDEQGRLQKKEVP